MSVVKQCYEKKKFITETTNNIMKIIEPLIITKIKRGNEETNFASEYPPNIAIRDYVYRIVNFSLCSEEVFYISTIYVKRLVERYGHEFVSNWTIHRILITSILVATKFHDDIYHGNIFYSRIGGIPVREICRCELELLYRLNFSLMVNSIEI